jgi:hypothetical protein
MAHTAVEPGGRAIAGSGHRANTAIFSRLHQVLLAALPAPHPEESTLLIRLRIFKSGRTSTGKAGQVSISSITLFPSSGKHAER